MTVMVKVQSLMWV